MASWAERQAQSRYNRARAQTGAAGQALMSQFQTGIAVDPRASYEKAVGASIDRFKESARDGVRSLRDSQVGSGRIGYGGGYKDEDDMLRIISQDTIREISDRALQTESLNLSRLGQIGQMGDAQSARYLDATSGDYNTLRAQRLQNQSEKRASRGGLLGSVIGAVGTIAGGPIGGIAAKALANKFLKN